MTTPQRVHRSGNRTPVSRSETVRDTADDGSRAVPVRGLAFGAGEPLPAPLQADLQARSGVPLDDVRVHRNSPRPAQIGALAYTQGLDIHLAPGQERHLPHEAWHAVQQKQGRVPVTRHARGLPLNLDPALEVEADAVAGGAAPESQGVSTGPTTPAVQGLFDLGSQTFKQLLAEQREDQDIVKSGAFVGYTTVGFEHEFAQMEPGGPFTGVSHVELARSNETLPLTGIGFTLETDADRALELVSPPFVVRTVGESMVPDAGQVRQIDRLIQSRLLALTASKPTFKKLVEGFKTDPGLEFGVSPATVVAANTGHETTGDYHAGANTVATSAIESMTITRSRKSEANITKPPISAQVNFATDLDTYEQARGTVDEKEVGPHSKPFLALEQQILAAFEKSMTDIKNPRVAKFFRVLARALSGELAVPSMEAARAAQQEVFNTASKQDRARKRGALANTAQIYHRQMASHVKDAGDVWIKDNPVNIGLGILDKTDWLVVAAIGSDVRLVATINGMRPGTFFKGAEQKVYAECFDTARGLVVAALGRMVTDARAMSRVADPTEKFHEPAQRPGFLEHDPTYLGARQDTYLPGAKVQLPGRDGPRLHVVETRGGSALALTDRLHIETMVRQETRAELPDAEIATALGHETAEQVTAFRDAWISRRLKAGDSRETIAAELRVPLLRVQKIQQKG